MLKINEGKLIKRILTIIVSFLLISCEDTMERSDGIFDLAFDMRLTQDSNGYYHLNIDSTKWQTLHRVSGSITENQFGVENFWIEWESNLYWYIGDTLGYIIKRNFNMDGQYVSYDTTYLTQFSGLEVPTSNQISYSNSKGELNNMIAPVKTMVGDTMKLTATWYDGYTNFFIVLY